MSGRAGRGLVTVNAGGLSEGVFESELFGHVKGAFTDAKTDRVGRFELADGGTLFLDEIANVPLNLQPKLLRVLETGDFERVGSSRTRQTNVRIVSATNSNLAEEVAAGRFRQDLLFRLNTIEIQLPPLRDRREDIPALAHHFLRQHAQRYRKNITGFEPGALQALLDHPWPGNIRELDHASERGVLMAQGSTIRLGELGLRIDRDATSRIEDMSLEDVEGFLIKKAMARFDGNVSQAAKALGLSRSALYRRLQPGVHHFGPQGCHGPCRHGEEGIGAAMQKAHGHRVEANDERQGARWESPSPHGQQEKPHQEASIPQHADHAQGLPHPAGRPGDSAAPPEINDRMGNLGQKRTR